MHLFLNLGATTLGMLRTYPYYELPTHTYNTPGLQSLQVYILKILKKYLEIFSPIVRSFV